MLGGAAVTVGLPFLDCFLNESGTALAATGAPPPVVFGTWFWGLGLNPGRPLEPKTEAWPNYVLPPDLAPIWRISQPRERLHRHEGAPWDGKTAHGHFSSATRPP